MLAFIDSRQTAIFDDSLGAIDGPILKLAGRHHVKNRARSLARNVADGKDINLAARNLLLLQKRKQGTRFVRRARHGQRSELQRTLRIGL